jgi:hypothetical protein
MARRKQSRGICQFCGHEIAKGSMMKHLATCPKRQSEIADAAETKRKAEALYHLRVQDAYAIDFWLDLEVRGSASLSDIDSYLRAIWLECCGHLSRFSTGGGWGGNEIGKRRRVDSVFQPDVEVTHIYDFGTSSETLLRMVGLREGIPLTARPIFLMARNIMPEMLCLICGQPATHFCTECMMEHESDGGLCKEHVADHPHEDYGEPIELVNSPRLGMCGYDGPADPPY